MSPQICVGTAQFGLNYGITNQGGQVEHDQVKDLLLFAQQLNVKYIDTAQSYGNSEQILGNNLPPLHNFHIISKLKSQQAKHEFTEHDRPLWEASFQDTCRNLKTSRLGSFLLHSPKDLRKHGSHLLVDWLLSLKERALVQRLGVSIYDAEELIGIDPRILDIVQLPLSLYDQRLLLDGTIEKLRLNSIAIHARSSYLQGLLLTPTFGWPDWISPVIVKHHQSLLDLSIKKKCSLIDLVLGFSRDQDALEALVLGLCNLNQFHQLIETLSSPSPWDKHEWQSWSVTDKYFLDPRLWPT